MGEFDHTVPEVHLHIGFGREGGLEGLLELVRCKAVAIGTAVAIA